MHTHLRIDLVTRLAALPALAGSGVVWQPAPIGQPVNLLVIRLISDLRDLSHGGPTGLCDARIQFDAYALDPADAEQMREAVIDNLHGFKGPLVDGGVAIDSCAHDNSLEDFDQATGLSRAACDLKIQYHLPVSS